MNILEIARTAYPERFAALVVSSREAVVSLSSDLAFVLPALTILREAAAGVGGQVEGDLGRAFLRKPGLTPAERDAVKELLVEKLRHL